MLYISNTFSLNMLDWDIASRFEIDVKNITLERAKGEYDFHRLAYGAENIKSAVGHEGTAKLISTLLGEPVEFNRVDVRLNPYTDWLLVFQVSFRLQEGQVLSFEEVFDLYKQGKIEIFLVYYKIKVEN